MTSPPRLMPGMKGPHMKLSAKELATVACSILSHAGATARDAERVATRLVDANLTGHDSHGVGMIPA